MKKVRRLRIENERLTNSIKKFEAPRSGRGVQCGEPGRIRTFNPLLKSPPVGGSAIEICRLYL